MKIKHRKHKVVITFQSHDSYFEMGNFLIQQSGLLSRYQKKIIQEDALEEIQICLEIKELLTLEDALQKLNDSQMFDMVYYLLYMTKQIEESGFLKRTCIWCRDSEVFYCEESRQPVLLLLPVSSDITYEDGIDWNERFLKLIKKICSYCTQTDTDKLIQQIEAYLVSDCRLDEVLDNMKQYTDSEMNLLVPNLEGDKEPSISLYHSGQEGILEFQTSQEEFVIGKQEKAVDGYIPFSDAVSRIHCKIIRLNRQFFLQDLDSVNHTMVNGEMIPAFSIIELNDSDLINIADVEFRVHIE